MLSEDNKAVIPIKKWFEVQSLNNDEYFKHLYVSSSPNASEISLTDTEKNRLKECAKPASEEFFEEFVFRKKLKAAKGTLGSALIKFCDELDINGAGKKGTADKAHDDVNESIRAFGKILNEIKPRELERIFNLRYPYAHAFSDYWNVLSGFDGKKYPSALDTCVQENSKAFRVIYNAHPVEFSRIIIDPQRANVDSEYVDIKDTPFSKIYGEISNSIDKRQSDLHKYLSGSECLDSESERSFKLHYAEEEFWIDLIEVYREDLKRETEDISKIIINKIHDYYYFEFLLPSNELLTLLERQSPSIIEGVFSLDTDPNLAIPEFLIALPHFKMPDEKIFEIVQSGKLALVKLLIQTKVTLNIQSGTLGSLISYAVKCNKLDIVVELIKSGVDISDRYGNDEDPLLLYSVFHGLSGVWEALLERSDLNINECDKTGYTPLHMAVKGNHTNLTEKLIGLGALVDGQDIYGLTPLHLAVTLSTTNVLDLLISKGANVNVCNHEGQNAYFYAINADHDVPVEIYECLLKAGANVNQIDNKGDSTLHVAIRNNKKNVVQWLLSNRVNVNSKNLAGFFPLDLALSKLNEVMACSLVKAGASFESIQALNSDNKKVTLLIFAIERGWGTLVSILVESKNINLDETDQNGNTALHRAVATVRPDTLSLLIQHNANIHVKDATGKTPLYWAIFTFKEKMSCMLIRAGGNLHEKIVIKSEEITLLKYVIDNNFKDALCAWIDVGGDLKFQSQTFNLNHILGQYLVKVYPKPYEFYIKQLILAGATIPDLKKRLLAADIHITLNEMSNNPFLPQLIAAQSFESLCQFIGFTPESPEALMLFAASVEIQYRGSAQTQPLADDIRRARNSSSVKELCHLISAFEHKLKPSQYTYLNSAINPWNALSSAHKDLVKWQAALPDETSSKKRSRTVFES